MFFYVSKIFWFALQPSGLLTIMLVVGAVLLAMTRYQQVGRRLLITAAVLFLLGGLLPLSTWLILPLEERFPRANLSGSPIDGIIVLGGVESARVAQSRQVHAINEGAERITEIATLARRYPAAKIVFTGGSVEIFSDPDINANAAKLVLNDLGIKGAGRLMLEKEALNTWQNALYAKKLVKPKPSERWLLVTSAWHMPRSIGAFRKAGFDIEAWPVDYRTANLWDAVRLFNPPSEGLRRLDLVTHEWMGLIVYWLTGRSSELFPGPN